MSLRSCTAAELPVGLEMRPAGSRCRVSTQCLEAARALANQYIDQAKHGKSPVEGLAAAATADGTTIAELGADFMADYALLKRLKAARKYQMAIDVSINPHLGTLRADLVTRENVRTAMKAIMVKQLRGTGARDRPKGGIEAARTFVTVLRKMLNWGIQEQKVKRKDNPASHMATNLPK